jgi:hypothetical protein
MHGEDAIFFWLMTAMVVVGALMAVATPYAFLGVASSAVCGGMAFGVRRMNRVPPPDDTGSAVGAPVPRPPARDGPGGQASIPRQSP